MHSLDLPPLLEKMRGIAVDAGAAILSFRNRAGASTKADGSPVTAADEAADHLIRGALQALCPFLVVSEESSEALPGTMPETFWLVDPLDGTREFVRGSGEFTVNIALVHAGRSVAGVVLAPALGLMYAAAEGLGALRARDGRDEPIRVAPAAVPPRVAVSRDHIGPGESEFLQKLEAPRVVGMGSSLKFCLVAEGEADFYPRYGRTREWDTAAAQCVVECAGGSVVRIDDGRPLLYGKPGLENPSFLASASASPRGA
jgi:3'(2'), 5'-bisphosphate nucleotidase